jgi:hypothetical protein
MQRDKSTKKIEQIEKVASSPEKITQSLTEVIDKFNIISSFKKIDFAKRSGILASTLTTTLLLLPFIGANSIWNFIKGGLNKENQGQKDAFYELKNNPKINWRSLLLLIAKHFQYIVNQDCNEYTDVKSEVSRIKATIFDDSALEKTGKNIEGIGYIHDHVKDMHFLGYKLLVCGFWDGSSFIPIDFSLHKEKRDKSLKKAEQRLVKKKDKILKVEKEIEVWQNSLEEKMELQKAAEKAYKSKSNKGNWNRLGQKQKAVARAKTLIEKLKTGLAQQKEQKQFIENELQEIKSAFRYCGLKKEDYKEQYKKHRDRHTAGHKRAKESGNNKLDMVVKMLKRTVKKGFVPDYVLTDTWFFSYKILCVIAEIRKNIKLVSMAMIGTAKFKILPIGRFMAPQEIIAKFQRKMSKTNRKYKSKYMQFQAEYQGIRVKIFLIKFGTHGSWRMLVTTDLDISFNKIIEVYKIRWAIEVFFKECKQYLLLGKCQSLDFDAQIADTTLTMIRFILLSYYKRIHYGTTIGGLFRQLQQSATEENVLANISLYFVELLQIFANLAGIDFITFYEDLVRNEEAAKIISKIGIGLTNSEYRDAA